MDENRYRIDTLYNGLKLILELAQSDDPMNLKEVMETLDIGKDTAFRTLKTLEELNFVTSQEGGYVLGEANARCWKSVRLQQMKKIENARRIYKELAITGEDEK
jgi:DNA-binding IclR family transcriptional regulator